MKNENLSQDIVNHALEVGRFEERIETFNSELEKDLATFKQNRIQLSESLSNLKRVHTCGSEICKLFGCETEKPESLTSYSNAPYLPPTSSKKTERVGNIRI